MVNGTDIEGLDVYLLDSFDYLSTLLEPGVTFVATEIPEFNRHRLIQQLRIASGEDEFSESYISLLESKHDMYVAEDFTKVLQINIPYRSSELHPTYKDLEVRKGEVKPIQIKAGSYALIGKSSDGCSWGLSWYFVQIVPKQMP